jgi:putative ABC transport system permease protein
MLWKNRTVTLAAIASLAVGIGANTTIFTFINAVFLRDLVVKNAERVANVLTTDEKQPRDGRGVSRPNYEDLRDRSEVFTGLANVLFVGASLSSAEGEPELLDGQLVSGNYFDVLGVQPVIGRGFLPEEDETPGTHPVVVLSHGFWSRRFGAAPSILGETITLNGQPCTVIGVAPASFKGTTILAGPDFWVPTSMRDVFLSGTPRRWYQERRALITFVYGRLKPGVTFEQAQAAVEVIGGNLANEYPDDNEGRNFRLLPLNEAAVPPFARDSFVRAGGLLATAVGLVLVIACANVANLLLSRSVARRREITVRLSLGATRTRLIRQLLTESVVLSLLGASAGILVALWGRAGLWSFRPAFWEEGLVDLSFDASVFWFTLLLSLLTGILFGLAPAIQASRPLVAADFKSLAEGSGGTSRKLGLGNLFVVGQIALCVVALVGSGLFLRSLRKGMEIDPGFDTDRLAMMGFNVGALGYNPARGEQFFDDVIDRASSVSGVDSATLTTNVPLWNGIGLSRTVFVEGRDPEAENNAILTPVCTVGLDFFETMGIPVAVGRSFRSTDRDGAPPVVVVNETVARRFWPGEDALGKRIHFHGQDDIVREIVGIVKDAKYQTIGEDPFAYIYIPRLQNYKTAMFLLIRTNGALDSTLALVREEAQQIDRNLPITSVQTMVEVLRFSLWPARTGATLLGLLGLIALMLACIGIYGVMTYSVNQRSREIGIRMALGARQAEVHHQFMKQCMVMVAAGTGIGLALAGLLSWLIRKLLYDVSPIDLQTFLFTPLILVAVALAASYFPARRASRVDPVNVLRYE